MLNPETASTPFSHGILLVIGPPWGVNAPPMSLGYLSKFLRSQKFDCRILDLNVISYGDAPIHQRQLWDVENDYVWRNTNPVEMIAKIDGFWRLVDEIIESKYEIVGFSLIDPNQFVSCEIIKKVKNARPRKIIVTGGPVCATLEERIWLKGNTNGLVDFMVVGEGEKPLSRLVERLRLGLGDEEITLPGVVDCRRNEDMIPRSMDPPLNLQDISFPDYDGFPLERYKGKTAAVLWSRGCISNCTFCKEKSLWDRYRTRSVDDILEEIKFHKSGGIHEFVVYDSLVNGMPEHLERLCDRIITHKLGIRWSALAIPNRSLDIELLRKMKLAGCFVLIFGLESGSEKVLKRMRKRFLLQEAIETLSRTKHSGIQTAINIIVGFPGETEADFDKTCGFLERYHPLIDRIDAITPFQLVKGTYISNHHEEFEIELPKERAHEYWSTSDGMNTHEIRMRRRKRIVEICKRVGIPIGKKFVSDNDKKDNLLRKGSRPSNKTDIVFLDKTPGDSLDYDTAAVHEFLRRFRISSAYYRLSDFAESRSAFREIDAGAFAIKASIASLKNAIKTAKAIKERNSNATIILWGPLCKPSPSELKLLTPFVDGIIFQQYEETFLRLAKHLETRPGTGPIPGIYKSNQPFIPLNPSRNLNKYPLPTYGEMIGSKPEIQELPLRLSKGCTHRCNFCSVYREMGPFRIRSARLVYEAMRYHLETKGICKFLFQDNIINGNPANLKELCRILIEEELPAKWKAKYIVSDEAADLPFQEMSSAGCTEVDFGFISGSNRLLKRMGKPFNIPKLERALEVAALSGMMTRLRLMVGHPGEEDDDFERTIDFLEKNRKHIDSVNMIASFYPQPGSAIHESPEEYGVILPLKGSPEYWHDGSYKNHSYRQKKQKEMAIVLRAMDLLTDLSPYVEVGDAILSAEKTIVKRYLEALHKGDTNRGVEKMPAPAKRHLNDPVINGVWSGFEVYAAPETLEIDLTNNCNLNCLACWCHSPLLGDDKFRGEVKRRNLSTRKILSVLDELDKIGGSVTVQLSGAGEPFLHPDIWKIIEAIKKSQMACQIVTNFSLLDKTGIKRLIDLEVDAVTASVWAGDSKTYLKNHPGVRPELFGKIRENLYYLTRMRGPRRLPKLKIYHVVNRHNANALHAMVDFALQVGADAVEFQMMDAVEGKTEAIQLDQKAKTNLPKQFQALRLRDDYTAAFIDMKHLEPLDNAVFKTELKEFGRLYPYLPKGFQYLDKNEKIRCPKGFESTQRSVSYTDFSIAYAFDKSICERCPEKKSCFRNDAGWGDFRIFPLSILGAGSFIRRLTHTRKAVQEYERQIIDQLPCTVGWTYARIKVNGHVIPCCKASDFPLGNIHEESFVNIWRSQSYATFRRKANTLTKSDTYFSRIDCYKSCDNLGMNLNTHLRLMRLTDKCETDKTK